MLTWNIERDDGHPEWPLRRARILAHVRAHRPDVVAMQEATPHQLQELAAALPEYALLAGQPTPRHEHNPFLVRREAYAVVESGTVWLSRSGRPEPDWGARHTRMATWAKLRAPDGAEVSVVNAHLDAESERSRVAAAKLLLERFPGAVLLGDFNAEPESEPHDILAQGRVDPAPATGMGTMHGHDGEADARYDWILVPEALRAGLARRVGDHDASDHYGLEVEVEPRRVDEDV